MSNPRMSTTVSDEEIDELLEEFEKARTAASDWALSSDSACVRYRQDASVLAPRLAKELVRARSSIEENLYREALDLLRFDLRAVIENCKDDVIDVSLLKTVLAQRVLIQENRP